MCVEKEKSPEMRAIKKNLPAIGSDRYYYYVESRPWCVKSAPVEGN